MSKIKRRSILSEDKDESFALLPEDIVESEILGRLPIKTLFKFKCVSKRYNSIISNLNMAHVYLKRVNSDLKSWHSSGLGTSLMYPFTNQKHLKDRSIPIDSARADINISSINLPRNETHKILCSSKGLILSLFYNPKHHVDNDHHHRHRFILCVSNPLTKKSVKLPGPRNVPLTNYSVNWVYGIVARRVQQSFTYKVVLIRRAPMKDWIDGGHYAKTSAYIFSSDTGSWATWDQVTCPTGVFINREAVFPYENMLHWIGDSRSNALISYDPFKSPDRFEEIPLPGEKGPAHFRQWPNGNHVYTGCRSMLYSGEELGLRLCEFTRQGKLFPSSQRLKMWRFVEGEWRLLLPRKFVFHSTPCLCEKLLVAPNPVDQYVFCHPFVLGNKLTVFNCKPCKPKESTREYVDMVLETPKGFSDGAYKNPLIRIDLCPWSSPSFYTANRW